MRRRPTRRRSRTRRTSCECAPCPPCSRPGKSLSGLVDMGTRHIARLRSTALSGTSSDSWMSCRRVGKLTTEKERKLPDKAFGLPESRKYPMPDPSHARNAKARAKQMKTKGKLSKKDYDRIVRKANRVINHCK